MSTHLCLGLPSGLFPSGFPTNILYAFRSWTKNQRFTDLSLHLQGWCHVMCNFLLLQSFFESKTLANHVLVKSAHGTCVKTTRAKEIG
jgi:hypothetical protein